MKAVYKTFTLLALAVMLSAGMAQAKTLDAGTVYLEPKVGIYGNSNHRISSMFTYGGEFGYFVADGLSIGILTALKNAGYCTAQKPCPFVSGQDAEVPSVKSIINGEQYSTIFKDTRELAKATVKLVDAVISGKQPEVNDTRTYNNGAKLMQSVLLKPVAVDKTNYKKYLVDSGYIKEDQLK